MRVPAIALILALAALAAAAGPVAGSGHSAGDFDVDAVLVMVVGPGEGLVGLDPESRSDLTYILPWTQRVFVRATVTDANGFGVNDARVTGTFAQTGMEPVALAFARDGPSGVYASQAFAYADGEVAFAARFSVTPVVIAKEYVPVPLVPPGTPP